jgi:hypothetical protein
MKRQQGVKGLLTVVSLAENTNTRNLKSFQTVYKRAYTAAISSNSHKARQWQTQSSDFLQSSSTTPSRKRGLTRNSRRCLPIKRRLRPILKSPFKDSLKETGKGNQFALKKPTQQRPVARF